MPVALSFDAFDRPELELDIAGLGTLREQQATRLQKNPNKSHGARLGPWYILPDEAYYYSRKYDGVELPSS